MSDRKPKRGRGRPPKYLLEPIGASAEELAQAIFRSADRKRKRRKKVSDSGAV